MCSEVKHDTNSIHLELLEFCCVSESNQRNVLGKCRLSYLQERLSETDERPYDRRRLHLSLDLDAAVIVGTVLHHPFRRSKLNQAYLVEALFSQSRDISDERSPQAILRFAKASTPHTLAELYRQLSDNGRSRVEKEACFHLQSPIQLQPQVQHDVGDAPARRAMSLAAGGAQRGVFS
jgi:hypothetical protein